MLVEARQQGRLHSQTRTARLHRRRPRPPVPEGRNLWRARLSVSATRRSRVVRRSSTLNVVDGSPATSGRFRPRRTSRGRPRRARETALRSSSRPGGPGRPAKAPPLAGSSAMFSLPTGTAEPTRRGPGRRDAPIRVVAEPVGPDDRVWYVRPSGRSTLRLLREFESDGSEHEAQDELVEIGGSRAVFPVMSGREFDERGGSRDLPFAPTGRDADVPLRPDPAQLRLRPRVPLPVRQPSAPDPGAQGRPPSGPCASRDAPTRAPGRCGASAP